MRTKLLALGLLSTAAVVATLLLLDIEPTTPGAEVASFQKAPPVAPARDTSPSGSDTDEGSASAVTTDSASSLPGTIAGILELPHDFSQTRAAFALAAAADATGLQALIAETQSIPATNDRMALTRILILRYAEIDPDEAARFVAQSTLESKPELISTIFNSWSKVELDVAVSAVDNLVDALHRRAAARGILAAFTESDVSVIGNIAERLAAIGIRDAVTPNLVARVASVNAEAALRLAGTIGTRETREAALENVLTIWGETDPAAAILALDRIQISKTSKLLSALGKAYARRSPAAALEWIGGFEDHEALLAVFSEVAQNDSALLLEAVRADYTPLQQPSIVEQIMQAIAIEDASAAAAAWRQLPAEFRPGAAGTIVSIWAQRDAAEAEAWVQGLPRGAEQQEALLAMLIMLAASTDHSRFARLFDMLDSSEDRDTYGHHRIGTLVRNGDADAAEQQLNLLNLSPETYRRARETIDAADR